jgi:hypothetical protein
MPTARSTFRLKDWTTKQCLLSVVFALALSALEASADASGTIVDRPTVKSGLEFDSSDPSAAIESKATNSIAQSQPA